MNTLNNFNPNPETRDDKDIWFPMPSAFNQDFVISCLMPEVQVVSGNPERIVHKFQCVFCKSLLQGRDKKRGNKIPGNLMKHLNSCPKKSQKVLIKYACAHLAFVLNRPGVEENAIKMTLEKANYDLDQKSSEMLEDFFAEFEKIDLENIDMCKSDQVLVKGSFDNIKADIAYRYIEKDYFIPPGTEIKGRLPFLDGHLNNDQDELKLIVPRVDESSFKIVRVDGDKELVVGDTLSGVIQIYIQMVNLGRLAKQRKDEFKVDEEKLPELFNFNKVPREVWHPLYKWTKKPRFKLNDEIECYYKGNIKCFPGKIAGVSPVGRLYIIHYHDQDVETLIPECRFFFPNENDVNADRDMPFSDDDKKYLKLRTGMESPIHGGTTKSSPVRKKSKTEPKKSKKLEEKIYDVVSKEIVRLQYPEEGTVNLQTSLGVQDYDEINETHVTQAKNKLNQQFPNGQFTYAKPNFLFVFDPTDN